MSEVIGENPAANPHLAAARTDGGLAAPDGTQVRMQLHMNDSLSAESSLLKTNNDDIDRQASFGMMLSKPLQMPDGTPIPVIGLDRLFEKLKVTDQEKQQAKRELEDAVLDSTMKQLIAYLEKYGGPSKLPAEAAPPKEGFPSGVSVTALKGDLGHDLWAIRTVLCAMPSLIATLRRLTAIIESSTRTKTLLPRPSLPRAHYSADAFVERKLLKLHSRAWWIAHWNAVSVEPATSLMIKGLHSIGISTPKKEIIARYAYCFSRALIMLLNDFFYENSEAEERRNWATRYITTPLTALFAFFKHHFYPKSSDFKDISIGIYGITNGVFYLLSEHLNYTEEDPSLNQDKAIATISVAFSNLLFRIAKGALYDEKMPLKSDLAATLVGSFSLLFCRDLILPNSLAAYDNRSPLPEAIQHLAHYTKVPGKLFDQLTKSYPEIAHLLNHYTMIVSKKSEQTTDSHVAALGEALEIWLKTDMGTLSQVPEESAAFMTEWFDEFIAIQQEMVAMLRPKLTS